MSNHNNPYYSGGGFMNSPSASQGSPGGDRKFPSQSLRPVVVRQILDSQDSSDNELMIDGAEASQLTVVAQVLYVQIQATNLVMQLDDGTGQVEARQWVEAGTNIEDVRRDQGVEFVVARTFDAASHLIHLIVSRNNQWIRVIGTLKSFHNKRHLAAQHIRPVKDVHEVYFALLEALSVHQYYTRGPPGAVQSTSAYTASQGTGPSADVFDGLSPIERKIMQYIINSAAGDEGVHVVALSKALGDVNASQVSDAIERLTEIGKIYNTQDEFHYALV
ncbi:replication factor A protein 2 [Tulasnella sp. 419]|nr:replication factor A protein 2 [Tulasnella sp. 419]